jgi:hypothetical protein
MAEYPCGVHAFFVCLPGMAPSWRVGKRALIGFPGLLRESGFYFCCARVKWLRAAPMMPASFCIFAGTMGTSV